MMRNLWPNLEGEEGLETVLEVPVPDEMFGVSNSGKSWRAIKSWLMRPHSPRPRPSSNYARRAVEIQFLLGVIGAPLIPLPVSSHHTLIDHKINDHHPIERSMASYIVQQYIAASGGEHALNSIESMCVIGKVKMAAAEGEDLSSGKVIRKMKSMKQGAGELGGFVLWQKRPHLWSLELMVSGFKTTAGCDGEVAWRQTPSRASRGPPRPLRRSLQGLDPKRTAELFSNSTCIGEKAINGEDCFVLKLEAESSTLRARSSSNSEIMRHTIWGCFSQKTGLLVHLQDSHSLRIKSQGKEVVWETRMESLIQDYRTINGVNIAHGGRTTVSLSRFGEEAESHTTTRMEEIWSIEEVDFNVKGLSTDCFLHPADLDHQECGDYDTTNYDTTNEDGSRYKVLDKYTRNSASRGGTKVVAIDEDYDDSDDDQL